MATINNKTIWITGASDGIGKELAIQLAQKGAKIILTARNKTKLEQVQSSLHGTGHIVFPMDLLETAAIPKAVEQLLDQAKTIDMLVNNAGISQRSLVKDTDIEVDRKIMELDHFAIVSLTKSLLPHFMQRQQGHFITISSVAGKVGVPMRSAYCAAKHAVLGFMGSLRAEVHADNIKVLVVAPGSVQTNISKNALEGDGKAHGVTDPAIANGLPVAYCAKRIIRAIEKDEAEIVIANRKEGASVYLYKFLPNVFFKVLTKMQTT